MIRRPPRSTRPDTLFPYTTLFRSLHGPSFSKKAVAASWGHDGSWPHLHWSRAGTSLTPGGPPVVRGRAETGWRNSRIYFAPSFSICPSVAADAAISASLLSSSEARRVGKECVSTCRSRWSPIHSKKKTTLYLDTH